MREEGQDGFAVGGVVNVGAGKEFVDNLFHLVVGEDLAVRNGDALGQREGDVLVYR